MTVFQTKKQKRIAITLLSVFAALAILFGGCAIYLSDYYRADADAIAAYSASLSVEEGRTENGSLTFGTGEEPAGFLFYPGAKVAGEAYIPLLRALAARGIFCVLVNVPFHLAILNPNAADGIAEAYPQVESWYIGGHSLGGLVAGSYLSAHTEDFCGLVLLGSYVTADLSATDLSVLSITATEDEIMNRDAYAENRQNLPEAIREVVIDGGCHAYFGMYGPQAGDGTPTITAAAQIDRTATEIAKLILGLDG